MKNIFFIIFLLISISSFADQKIICQGETQDNYPFTLEITHLNEFNGPYQKFTSQFSIIGHVSIYQGRIFKIVKPGAGNKYEDIGFNYFIERRPPLSTKEFVNLDQFSVLTGTPNPGTNLHTELRYNGPYSGEKECFPASEMHPGGCYPKFNGRNFKVPMLCKVNSQSDFDECFQKCIQSDRHANRCIMECTDTGGNGA